MHFISDESIVELIRLCNPTFDPSIVIDKMTLPLFRGIKSIKVENYSKEHEYKVEGEILNLT